MADGPTYDELLKERIDKKWDSFSWTTTRALISSVNHVLNLAAPKLVCDLREEWLDKEGRGVELEWPDRVVNREADTSFVVLGDPGEQDASQFVLAPPLAKLAEKRKPGFMVICSDVIYPSGDVNDYADGYYIPYQGMPDLPVFALPGNHDWYDGLTGFMWNFCDRSPLEPTAYGWPEQGSVLEGLVRLLWRRPSRLKGYLDLQGRRTQRTPDRHFWRVLQPGSYFAIQTKHLLVVCIDTGIQGEIDKRQGEWLVKVSRRPGHKVLLTGKPLVVDNEYRPCEILGGGIDNEEDGEKRFLTVDDVVRWSSHDYVAAIGGDIHNFQHYPARVAGRELHYVVSGGGGAYMSATHPIGYELRPAKPATDVPDELTVPAEPWLYPTREQSLGHFAKLVLPRIWRFVRVLLCLIAGAGLAALLIPIDADPGSAGTLAAGTGIAAAVLLGVQVGTPATWRKHPRFRAVVCVLALVIGAALVFATRWLDPSRWGWYALGWLVTMLSGSVLAYAMRRSGWWREKGDGEQPSFGRCTAVITILVAILFAFSSVAVGDGPVPWIATSTALTFGAAAAGWRLRASNDWSSSTALAIAVVVQLYGLLAVATAVAPAGADVRRAVLGTVSVIGIALVTLASLYAVAALAAGVRSYRQPLTFREAWGRIGEPVQPLLFPLFAATVVGFAALLGNTGHQHGLVTAAMTVALPVCALFALDAVRRTTEPRLMGRDVLVFAAAVFVLWKKDRLDSATGIALTAVATIAVGGVVLYVRHRFKVGAYKLDAVMLVAAALALAWVGGVQHTWVPRHALIGSIVFVALAVTVVIVHLVFLGAYKMPFDPKARGEELPFDDSDISAILKWRRGTGPEPSDKQMRRRADIVFPGLRRPHGPLQQKVAEVFDSDRPPFFKNFLVLTTTETELRIEMHPVTGCEPEPPVYPIPVPLPRSPGDAATGRTPAAPPARE